MIIKYWLLLSAGIYTLVVQPQSRRERDKKGIGRGKILWHSSSSFGRENLPFLSQPENGAISLAEQSSRPWFGIFRVSLHLARDRREGSL